MKMQLTMCGLTAAVALAIAGASTFGVGAALASPAIPEYKLLKTIPTGGTDRWDYLAVDPAAHRLYVPRSSHVQVVDLNKGTVVGDIPNTNGVHGVAIAPDQQHGFASDGENNNVDVFDLKTFKHVATVNAGKRPDAILYDPASKHVFVMNHAGGDITVIDPADLNVNSRTQTIPVGGILEFAVADGAGHVFVNVEDKSEIAEIDSKQNKVLARWPLAPGEGPSGLAMDVKNHRLFAGCRNQKMIVLDSISGKQLAAVDIGKGVDGVAFDPLTQCAFSANGKDGTISVVRETSPGKFGVVQTVTTLKGARTIALDESHQLLLPCNAADGKTFVIAVVGEDQTRH